MAQAPVPQPPASAAPISATSTDPAKPQDDTEHTSLRDSLKDVDGEQLLTNLTKLAIDASAVGDQLTKAELASAIGAEEDSDDDDDIHPLLDPEVVHLTAPIASALLKEFNLATTEEIIEFQSGDKDMVVDCVHRLKAAGIKGSEELIWRCLVEAVGLQNDEAAIAAITALDTHCNTTELECIAPLFRDQEINDDPTVIIDIFRILHKYELKQVVPNYNGLLGDELLMLLKWAIQYCTADLVE